LAALLVMSRGHHSFAKQWAWGHRELIGEDALSVLTSSTIGGESSGNRTAVPNSSGRFLDRVRCIDAQPAGAPPSVV